jgi:hypothetical protein
MFTLLPALGLQTIDRLDRASLSCIAVNASGQPRSAKQFGNHSGKCAPLFVARGSSRPFEPIAAFLFYVQISKSRREKARQLYP